VVSKSIGLLYRSDDRDAFWQALTPAHREKMSLWLSRFDESAEPFAIKADPYPAMARDVRPEAVAFR
jgi:hypothetical protein